MFLEIVDNRAIWIRWVGGGGSNWPIARFSSVTQKPFNKSSPNFVTLINTYSMKQPDLYYFETHKNDVTSLVKFCMENTSRRRVFSVNFD